MGHPAKFTDSLMPIMERMIPDGSIVLDPFAGTGKIHILPFKTVGIEIEKEWASLSKGTICADSMNIPFSDGFFDAVCTSPTYGNRMADHFESKDGSKRATYRHALGRKLSGNNSGRMQWGKKYKHDGPPDKHPIFEPFKLGIQRLNEIGIPTHKYVISAKTDSEMVYRGVMTMIKDY